MDCFACYEGRIFSPNLANTTCKGGPRVLSAFWVAFEREDIKNETDVLSPEITLCIVTCATSLVFLLKELCFIRVKVAVKARFILAQATKAQRGSRGIALLFL
jgi:hypothetical protein